MPGIDYRQAAAERYAAAFITESLLTAEEETVPRVAMASTSLATASGSLRLTHFTARASRTHTKLRSLSGNTAAVGATLCRKGIYEVNTDGSLTLIGSTPNTTTLWAATSTLYETATSASFALVRGRRYAAGLLFVGTTAPTMAGAGTGLSTSGEHHKAPRIGATVTGQTDLPASISAATVGASNTFGGMYYMVCVP